MADAKIKTRGDGPVTVSYIDGEGKVSKRVPDKVVAIQVADKSGKTKSFKIGELPAPMINGLAAFAIAKKIDIYVRNTAKNDTSADVLGIASGLYDTIKSGKLYTRQEGTGGGKTFDIENWVSVMVEAAQLQQQPLNSKKKDALRAVLTSLQGKERQAQLLKWQKSPFVKAVLANKKLEQAKAEAKTGKSDSIADLF